MKIIDNQADELSNFAEIANDEGCIVLIDKPIEWTSFDVVNKLRYASKVKKVGHAGTLDPLATGLVLIAFGKATKQINDLVLLNKVYKAIFRLGATTLSDDSEYPEENLKPLKSINIELIENIIKDNFLGEIQQMPPQFSAKKVKGKRAYKSAREGKEVELAPVNLKINKFDILNYQEPFLEVLIDCSKGTYIRALARDLGQKLDCGGYMSGLIRTSIGEFKLDKAFQIDEFIEKLNNDSSI